MAKENCFQTSTRYIELQRKAKHLFQIGLDACIVRRTVRTLVKVGLATTITDLPNFAIYVCAMDTLHKSVGLTVGMRVGRCVSHVRDVMSV